MGSCDVDEILKQLKVLDNLKQLRENMGEGNFMAKWPELSGLNTKIDAEIAAQEEALQDKMSECGQIPVDELPDLETLPELPELPEVETTEI
jgi:hypothetical protein